MIDYLLGNAPLGEGQGGAVGSKPRHIGPPYYLVNDTFTTDRSAGAVNGTRAEPGPGKRDVNDTGSKLSLSGGNYVIASGAPGTGNPRLLYAAQGRRAGLLAIIAVTTPASGSAGPARAGWTYAPTGIYGTEAVAFGNSNSLEVRVNLANVAVGASALNTAYVAAVALRASGAFYFIKGGAFTNWTLLWSSTGVTDTPMAPVVAAINNGAGCSGPHFRVPAALWLPTPLASDGFSAWGTTDGLGHAEGVAGGLGAGGSGLSWTSAIGAWDVLDGVAVCNPSGGIAAATVDSGKTDAITTAKVTRSGGVAGVLAAYVDADNHVRAVHNGTNAQLIKRVSGSDTNVISAAATYSAAAEIRVIREGTAYRLYYNNALVGSQQTISDAVFNSVTKQGLYSTDDAAAFDDFTVYARGSGGEHSALDAF